jgi:hypothetical protein
LADKLREEVWRVLDVLGFDLQTMTLGKVRKAIEAKLCQEAGSLDEHKDYINELLQEKVQSMQVDSPAKKQVSSSEDFSTWSLERLQETLENLGEDSDGDKASLVERLESLQTVEASPAKKAKTDSQDFNSWTLERLQETLENLGEDSDGDKATLVQRLVSMQGPASQAPQAAASSVAATPAKSSASANEATPAKPSQSISAAKESETGSVWTYEVTGKKIGIRTGPGIDTEPQGEYIENGEMFNVVERVRGGGDVRVYLRLADGRGWAYDRSAKDDSKIVVDELGSKPVA